nr:uncharacterized protein LOC109156773 [Ipomoea batatas]
MMSSPLLPTEQSSIDYKSHNSGFTQAEEMVNTDVVPHKRWQQLKNSIVLGDYDMKIKFIPSLESPDNYKLDIIKDEKNSNEEEVEIPPQYRERAQNWKMQMRKRSSNGKVEKAEEMVNTDVVPQKRWRQLKTSIVLGDYDMKVKFIPSAESPGNYKVDIIMDEKNSNEEEVEIPAQYRERAQNWKMQIRKRTPSGAVENKKGRKGITVKAPKVLIALQKSDRHNRTPLPTFPLLNPIGIRLPSSALHPSSTTRTSVDHPTGDFRWQERNERRRGEGERRLDPKAKIPQTDRTTAITINRFQKAAHQSSHPPPKEYG